MGSKKQKDNKPPHEYYEVDFHNDTGKKIGEALDFSYEDGRCCMSHYYWGSEMEYECNRFGRVESHCYWDEENTKKMMLKTGTENGKDLVKAIYKLFRSHKNRADAALREWCENEGIEYDYNVYY